jgi:dicarboxylate transporter 10
MVMLDVNVNSTYSTVRFGMYELMKDHLTKDGGKLPFYQSLACSLVAGAAGGIAGNPADIVNIRYDFISLLSPQILCPPFMML